jgi:hypothetical protein
VFLSPQKNAEAERRTFFPSRDIVTRSVPYRTIRHELLECFQLLVAELTVLSVLNVRVQRLLSGLKMVAHKRHKIGLLAMQNHQERHFFSVSAHLRVRTLSFEWMLAPTARSARTVSLLSLEHATWSGVCPILMKKKRVRLVTLDSGRTRITRTNLSTGVDIGAGLQQHLHDWDMADGGCQVECGLSILI